MLAAFLLVTAVLLLAGFLWSITTIRYHVASKHLKVTWLGMPVRRVRLDNIKYITTKPVWFAERWYNTFLVGHRMLVIRRRSGLIKHFVISPKSPFVFRADLERQRKAFVTGSLPETTTSRQSTPVSPRPVSAPKPADPNVAPTSVPK